MSSCHQTDCSPSSVRTAGFALLIASLLPALFSPAGASAPGLPGSIEPMEWEDLALRQAILEWRAGNLNEALSHLEEITIDGNDLAPSSPMRSRALFLRAILAMRLGDHAGFRAAVRASAGLGRDDLYSDQLQQFAILLDPTSLASGMDEGDSFEPSDISALGLFRDWLAAGDRGPSAVRALEGLAGYASDSPGEAELRDAAKLHLASQQETTRKEARDLLASVPAGSRFASRAAHMLAILAQEESDSIDAARYLDRALQNTPSPSDYRSAALARASIALSAGRPDEAYDVLRSAETVWFYEESELARLSDPSLADSLWHAWESELGSVDALLIDLSPEVESIQSLALISLDLTQSPENSNIPSVRLQLGSRSIPSYITFPDEASSLMEETRRRERDGDRLSEELRKTRFRIELEESRLARLKAYLESGILQSAGVHELIEIQNARLDSLLSRVSETLGRLDDIRTQVLARVAERSESMGERTGRNELVAGALSSIYVQGPNRERAATYPEGVPPPGELLAWEDSLSRALDLWIVIFSNRVPDLVNRSHDEIWVPRMTTGLDALARRADAQLARSELVRSAIDSTLAMAGSSDRLRIALTAADSLELLIASSLAERDSVSRLVVGRTLESSSRHHFERGEGLLYTLAIASDELAWIASHHPGEGTAVSSPGNMRAEAIERFSSFLAGYPDPVTRGDVRFRLASLELAKAKEDFSVRMAAFLDGPGAGTGATPFVDYGPAYDLYKSIRDQDQQFHRMDAVLFNIGMIQLDEGDHAGIAVLTRLVRHYPETEHRQEALLRLGDDSFHKKQFASSIPWFEEAARGENAEFTAIALYKTGWAHFNLESYKDGARSFRRLLDHYEEGVGSGTADLREEAREYLIHSLARAGGAGPFEELFSGEGKRGYERSILAGLSTLFRRFSLIDESVDIERLWLEKYPTDPSALLAARRLIETLDTANRKDDAMSARLDLAPRFLNGAAWSEAIKDDSLRAEGDSFAFDSYSRAALSHHVAARASGDTTDWEDALEIYEIMIATWSDESRSALLHYYAGEAAGFLGEYDSAVNHFENGVFADSLEIREDAAWQVISMLDTWYESSRGEMDTGPDSIAASLITASDRLLPVITGEKKRADVIWRAATLAYYHDRTPVALEGLERFLVLCDQDERAPVAARLLGQTYFELAEFDRAALAYERAGQIAVEHGIDSLAVAMEALVPLCLFRQAEATAISDSDRPEIAARLFEKLAADHDSYEHAATALYRAGLGFREGESPDAAVRCWTNLIDQYTDSEWVKDSRLQIASTWEEAGRPAAAARAYESFADFHGDDPDAGDALWKASKLLALAGDPAGADHIQTIYLDRFPGDVETALAVLGSRAGRELDAVGPDNPISSLMSTGAGSSHLARYQILAADHPDLSDPVLLARAGFLAGEEASNRFRQLRITHPLSESIAAKKELLDVVFAKYRTCIAMEAYPWNRAAAYRIGSTLVHFADAVRHGEPPPDLTGDDAAAYREVLSEQAWEFDDAAEQAWEKLLRQSGESNEDEGGWIGRTRRSLWPRVARRFVHMPEMDFPLVAAEARAVPVIAASDEQNEQDEHAPISGDELTLDSGSLEQPHEEKQ